MLSISKNHQSETEHKGNCSVCCRELISKRDPHTLVCFGISRKVMVNFTCPDCIFTFPVMIECCECFKLISSHDAIQCGCDFVKLKISVARYYCSNKCAVKYNKEMKKTSELKMKARCMTCQKYDQKMKKCSGCRRVYYCSVKCQKKDWTGHEKICGD